ncbi:probable protein ABIL3 isoform X2 [Salvia miltiorrhiza]|uniref:probable protein ABIL3 isoform X2 n=1 Tax=Salvia miltiorrhiza TaxID=226208 RepID=UPI0025ACEF68|nr:probable protein ABIL3 isoform X2 [Salvia miltiorrhiza]
MDEKMVEEDSEAVVDDVAQFHKSLKELRNFSSQLYQAADYCKTAFLSSQDKTQILETTKEYVSRAVVVVVDHLGTISANLECCISKTDSLSQTEGKIESLKQRIGTCQIYSYRISVPRFQWGADFPRYHRRYVSPPSKDSTVWSDVSRYSKRCIDAKNEEAMELLFNCNSSSVVESSSSTEMKKKNVVPVPLNSFTNYKILDDDDGLSVLPKTNNLVFQFQEVGKLKRGAINWKAMMQSKDIAALIRRGKRLLA